MSTIFSIGDVVLWNLGGPTLPGYVGIVEDVYDREHVALRFWSTNTKGFYRYCETHEAKFITKIGNVNEWDAGIF